MGSGREVQEGGDTCPLCPLWLIHVDVWQKPTQYYKAIILQLKINVKSLVLTWDLAYAKLNLGPIVLFLTHINELNPAIIQRFIM